MKKYIILLLLLIIPLNVFAGSYKLSNTDIKIDLGDDWIVITRDNVDDEGLLSGLGLTKEYMESVFNDNSAYMDAITYWDDAKSAYVELFIIITDNDTTNNINSLSNEEILKMMDSTNWYSGADTMEIYENNNSKFFHAEYTSKGLYLSEYIAIINNKNYIIKYQSSAKLDDAKKSKIKDIMDTVEFDYEKENVKPATPVGETSKKVEVQFL